VPASLGPPPEVERADGIGHGTERPALQGGRDLMVVALAALLAAGFALTDAPTLLRVLTGLPAALVLPGYAPGWLLFPRGGDLNWPERKPRPSGE